MKDYGELLELIDRSSGFSEVRASGLLPEPDADDGYYFVSYSHKDYKAVLRDIVGLSESGIRIWYDRGLESGKSWIKEVRQKMSSYYCKGIIFYVTKNYLESESCMREYAHFLSTGGHSGLFLTEGDALSENWKELDAALEFFGLSDGVIFDGETAAILYDSMPISAPTEEKIAAIGRFSPPELLEYTYVYGSKQHKGMRIVDLFLGRVAVLSGIKDKNVTSVTVPEWVMHGGKKYRVIGISSETFSGCELLEEVTLGDGWVSLDKHAFVRCPSLKRVRLGTPLKRLGNYVGIVDDVFDRCPLAHLEFSDPHVCYRSAFSGSPDLVELKHDGTVRYIGACFAGCHNLRRACLGKKDNFGEGMFADCTSLTEVVIPKNNLTYSMKDSFRGCRSLEHIELPAWTVTIGEHTFSDCSSLTEIRIPKRTSYIHRTAFLGCERLSVVITEGKKFDYMESRPYHRKAYFDEIFPALERMYMRHVPRGIELFRADFAEVESDMPGYTLFERRRSR